MFFKTFKGKVAKESDPEKSPDEKTLDLTKTPPVKVTENESEDIKNKDE